MTRRVLKADWCSLSYVAIVVYIVMSLLPLLSSGYYSDDLMLSTEKGWMELRNVSFVQYVIEMIRSSITSDGRLYPVHLFAIVTISCLFSNLLLYKSLVLLLIVANAFMLAFLIQIITHSRNLSHLAMLVLPGLFQFRLYHDPILSFFGVMQIFVALILLALKGIKDGYVVLSSIDRLYTDREGNVQVQSHELRSNVPPKT